MVFTENSFPSFVVKTAYFLILISETLACKRSVFAHGQIQCCGCDRCTYFMSCGLYLHKRNLVFAVVNIETFDRTFFKKKRSKIYDHLYNQYHFICHCCGCDKKKTQHFRLLRTLSILCPYIQ